MTPAVVLSSVSVVLLLLYTFVAMPLAGFVFFRETRDYITKFARYYFNYRVKNYQEILLATWGVLAVLTGFYEVYFFVPFLQ